MAFLVEKRMICMDFSKKYVSSAGGGVGTVMIYTGTFISYN